MKIGLIDCDSYHFPNLPLMKLSAYYKAKGNNVEFAKRDGEYEVLFVSKIFTETKEPELPKAGIIFRGGSGYDLENTLPDQIEHIYPDYSLYPQKTQHMDS